MFVAYARGIICVVICGLSNLLDSPLNAADEPLHRQIDKQVEARLTERKITPAGRSTDAEFVRRVYLDLNGIIPTAAQARAFLDDASPDKRAKLINALLANPDYALHMGRVLDVMLNERRVAAVNLYDTPIAVWREYLTDACAENRHWDVLVREILASDGTEEKSRGPAKFYLVRDVDAHQIARDIGRVFLGVDLQCAQCHDDPRFKDYRQSDYYGIYAFVERLRMQPLTPRGAKLVETAEGKTTFTSVFTTKSGETNPKLLHGEMIPDAMVPKGKEYVVPPARRGGGGVPTYSRRLKLAEQLPRSTTEGFSRNIANRLWAHMLGRGIVHPLDLAHAENRPSDPKLLDLLTRWMAEHDHDLKGFLREVALSETYQRSSTLPAGVKALPADAFAVASLRALTAEQFRWSLFQAAGRIEQYDAAFKAQQARTRTVSESDPIWKFKLARNTMLERQTQSLMAVFAATGKPDGDFQPIVDQALYLLNNPNVESLFQEIPGNLFARLVALRDASVLTEELYLSVFARRPTETEIEEVRNLLASANSAAERRERLKPLIWGLMLTAEFRLNH